ncbi:hypothetical protein [Dyadobacter psychrotolerans]|uniref:Uncharacterized protein n=1 Tax=Dyadobacter psychrotolerans TaxID=2541721 RepID=A0A4R5E2D5_9BACT|nr:hypothetical protein [Dyadobacter psychrotolerans]TDE18243.1 hypothetical protein E0F88_01485 [Dyadobacter psychrotolerans]
MKFKILLFFVSAIALASCVDIPDFSDTPTIFYNGIDQFTVTDESGTREKVVITIDFEDGDGDLGATDSERDNDAFKKPYGKWGNYELVTARKLANGKWLETILSEDSVKWMDILKPDGKPGPIKGKLDLNTYFARGNNTIPITLKFKIRIRDRALHVSNQIETDSVVVPGYPL